MNVRMTAAAALLATSAAAADRALVIGIDDYSAVADAASLSGAASDAVRFAGALSESLGFPQDAVTIISDSSATYDAILTILIDRLVTETGPGDRAVFYFAGHGTTLEDGTPALVAHDGDTILGRIPLSTIGDILNVISDRDVMVVLDAGYSEGAPGTRGLGSAAPDRPPSLGARVEWHAAGAEQWAWEDRDGGVFTGAWIKALDDRSADNDGDGMLAAGELASRIAATLTDWCAAAAPCVSAGGNFTGSFAGNSLYGLKKIHATPSSQPRLDPILADDDAPASFRETLGFVTDLFAPSNDAGLTLSIKSDGSIRIGDTIAFTAEAERPGSLLLLDVDPEGRLAQVYPSSLSTVDATRLFPGQSLTIPNAIGANGLPLRIRVSEPAGQGLLLGLFVEGDLPLLTDLMPAGLEGGPVPNAGQSLFEISQRLLEMSADPEAPVAWSATYLTYRIEP